MSSPQAGLKVGFGCLWNQSRDRTWSHTPTSLLRALERTGATADLGYEARFWRHVMRLRYVRYRDGRLRSSWRYQEATLDAAARAIARQAEQEQPDVVVTVPDIGIFESPFFVYQDLSYDLVLREVRAGNETARANFSVLSIDDLERLARRQREVFSHAAGVFAMSEWYRRSLVEDSGLDPERVTVVRPGATAALDGAPLGVEHRSPKLLFVGRDFVGKGGDLLVEAIRLLRANGEDLSLTVIGPEHRPDTLPEESWIDFAGELPAADVAAAMRSHAAFVLPTRFEGYGIVFHEALRAGTPCVGPDAFAIPEIIEDGVNGALFSEWDSEAIAAAVSRSLAPPIRQSALDSAAGQADQLSWERAAWQIRAVAETVCERGPARS